MLGNKHEQLSTPVRTLVVTKPEKCQLIHPPMTIMGRTLVRFPLSISVIMEGSVIGLGGATFRCCVFRMPLSSLLKKCRRIRKACFGRNLPFSRRLRLRIRV